MTRKTRTDIDDRLIKTLQKPVFWTFVLGGFYLSISRLGVEGSLLTNTKNVFLSLVFVLWGFTLSSTFQLFAEKLKSRMRTSGKSSLDADFIPFINNIAKIALLVVTLLMILQVWGIDVTPILASAGIAGMAVAFAAKDTVANLFGGVSVFMDRPYKVGDYVIIKNEYRGEVLEIGMRSTKIKTRDNVLLTVPNSVMVTDAVVNETGFDPRLRIRLPFGISYESDLEKTQKVLEKILASNKKILKDPEPRVRFRGFGESAINLEVLATIKNPSEKGIIMHGLVKTIYKEFKKQKVTIAYPQMDVHLKN